MRVGVAASDLNDWTYRAIVRGFACRGVDTITFSLSKISGIVEERLSFGMDDQQIEDLECLIVRDMGRGAPQDVAFRFETLKSIESDGLSVINPPDAILRAANKFATTVALKRAGVPTPRTTITNSIASASSALERYGKAVSKPLFGYKGKGIILLTSEDPSPLGSIISTTGIVYLQEFVQNPGRDIRVFVVGDEVIGAIFRVAPTGSWISNLARGGSAEPCKVTDELECMALAASSAVGTSYCGVDILESSEGLKVIEVNGTPSGKGLFSALGMDAGDMIARHVLTKIEERS